jgi:imidazoleglycerol-phosphate dehydratase
MRTATINRKTKETDITLTLNLDGTGKSEINSGCGFLDHMLTLFAKHGGFDLKVKCVGDKKVDFHHSVEDVGIALGQAFFEAVGDKKGINRYGDIILPMDEALIMVALDLSGRSYLAFNLDVRAKKIGEYDSELTEEFFIAFTNNAKINLHIKKLAGKNSHHIVEGAFKAFARALKKALATDLSNPDALPSTKGVL